MVCQRPRVAEGLKRMGPGERVEVDRPGGEQRRRQRLDDELRNIGDEVSGSDQLLAVLKGSLGGSTDE